MAQATITKTRLIIEYYGDGVTKGGSFSYSNIKPDASDEGIFFTAHAINELQTDFPEKIYKSVETVISE